MHPRTESRLLRAALVTLLAALWLTLIVLLVGGCQSTASVPAIPDSCESHPFDTCFNTYGSLSQQGGLCYVDVPDWFFEGCHTLTDTLARCRLTYPEWYARISWAETQQGVTGVGSVNNLFGMRWVPWRDSTANGYSVYPSTLECIADLTMWERALPPYECTVYVPIYGQCRWWVEHPYHFFCRRGWQPREIMPAYWAYLQTLNQ